MNRVASKPNGWLSGHVPSGCRREHHTQDAEMRHSDDGRRADRDALEPWLQARQDFARTLAAHGSKIEAACFVLGIRIAMGE